MTQADLTPTTSRRAAIGMAGAALLLAGAAIPAGADAELIAVCREFDAIEAHCRRFLDQAEPTCVTDESRDNFLEPYRDRQEALLDQLCRLRATTADGHLARARSLAGWLEDASDADAQDEAYWDQRMLAALRRDLMAEA
jgi:hypothetical protein